MERLEKKQVNGHTYYYYSKWAKVDGRCRRVWQKYLGKLAWFNTCGVEGYTFLPAGDWECCRNHLLHKMFRQKVPCWTAEKV